MVISQGRPRTSSKSRPIVGSALARIVLSIDPMNKGSSTPKVMSRASRWLKGAGAVIIARQKMHCGGAVPAGRRSTLRQERAGEAHLRTKEALVGRALGAPMAGIPL